MAVLQELSLVGAVSDDNWHPVLEVVQAFLGAAGLPVYLVEGFVNVQTNGGTFQLPPKGAPAPSGSTGGGVKRAGDSVSGFGPASGGVYKGYPLHRLYVRNTTPGSNVTIALEGVVQVGDD